ncbi:hypothetical protein L4D06_14810 [Enterovibrio makurazakiensis]|uniref:hypothetical protein n=1 Tax=Enterovibrio makurazakiensis TaxID=2910232 RepID=UPI003D1A7C6D
MSNKTKAFILTLTSIVNMFVRNIALCVCVEHTSKLDSDAENKLDETSECYNELYICIGESAKNVYYFWHRFTSSSRQFRHVTTLTISVQLLNRSLVELAYALCVSVLSMISFYRYAPGAATLKNKQLCLECAIKMNTQRNSNHHQVVAVFLCLKKCFSP